MHHFVTEKSEILSPLASLAIRFFAFMTETLKEKLACCEKVKRRRAFSDRSPLLLKHPRTTEGLKQNWAFGNDGAFSSQNDFWTISREYVAYQSILINPSHL